MRTRAVGCVPLLALFFAGAATAQSGRWAVGTGALAPTGEYSTHDKLGWHAVGAFTTASFSHGLLGLRLEALYGRTPRKTTGYGASQLFGFGSSLELHPAHATAWSPTYQIWHA